MDGGWYSGHDEVGRSIVSDFAQRFRAHITTQNADDWEAERIAQRIANDHNRVQALEAERDQALACLRELVGAVIGGSMTGAHLYRLFAKLWYPDSTMNWRAVPKQEKAKWEALAKAVHGEYEAEIRAWREAVETVTWNAQGY